MQMLPVGKGERKSTRKGQGDGQAARDGSASPSGGGVAGRSASNDGGASGGGRSMFNKLGSSLWNF